MIDFPGSLMKLKVWLLNSLVLSYSRLYFGEAFLRLVLAIVLKGSSFRILRKNFLASLGC